MKYKANLFILSLVLLIISIIFISGCGLRAKRAVEKEMKSWVGRHKSDLIASWGNPQDITPDGKGGTVLFYSQLVKKSVQFKDPLAKMSRPPHIRKYFRTRTFYVNSEGYIYDYKWDGL
jgi:hypothetical protein